MEHLQILLNKPREFDEAVHGKGEVPSIPEAGDLSIITKDLGTDEGRALAVITFTAEHEGKRVRCQAVTTVRVLEALLGAINGRYENGKVRPHLAGI